MLALILKGKPSILYLQYDHEKYVDVKIQVPVNFFR